MDVPVCTGCRARDRLIADLRHRVCQLEAQVERLTGQLQQAQSRTRAGARAQSVLMSVWRTCWQQGRSALEFLSQLLGGTPVALALPRDPPCKLAHDERAVRHRCSPPGITRL
jgi:hypothetical protein